MKPFVMGFLLCRVTGLRFDTNHCGFRSKVKVKVKEADLYGALYISSLSLKRSDMARV